MTQSDAHLYSETVIFGSGLSGLSCARSLALQNRSVTVIEKAPQLGGHLLPFERGGAVFEVGIHYIADTGPQSLWHKACERLKINFTYNELDKNFEELYWPNGKMQNVSWPLQSFIADMLLKFPDFEIQLNTFESHLNILWEFAQTLDYPFRSAEALKKALHSPHKFTILKMATQNLEQYFKNTLKLNSEIIEILNFQHTLIGVAPKKVSALVHLLVHRYYFEKPCFIEGGGQALIDALIHNKVDYLTSTNATMEQLSQAEATEYQFPKARFKITTHKKTFFCHNVVWTPDPRALSTAAPRITLPILQRIRLNSVQEPHALTVGYFATKRKLTEYGMHNCNIWLMGSGNANDSYQLNRNIDAFAEQNPLYISTGSLRDHSALSAQAKTRGFNGIFQAMFLCPNDIHLWNVSDSELYRTPERKGGQGRAYRMQKEKILDILIKRVVQKFPTLEGELIWSELGTPLTHSRFLNSISRNGYGYSPTVFDLLFARPSFNSGICGLYFCGSHIKPAHGIVTALLNGEGLARRLTN